jgi:chemotaxis methyl-accepting protein methylase
MLFNLSGKIIEVMKNAVSVDLSGYRQDMLGRRIAVRMAHLNIKSPEKYCDLLESEPDEAVSLLDAIAINVSHFFRDPAVYDLLEDVLIPEMLNETISKGDNKFRAWSAGCACGEEAYSIAILLHQILDDGFEKIDPLIFATDIDRSALDSAAHGCYQRSSLEYTRLGVVDKYFKQCDDKFKVNDFIREMVKFSIDDLLSAKRYAPGESIFGEFDLILCRNVLIYFEKQQQLQVIERLLQALAPGGYLVLGQAESLQGFAVNGVKPVVEKCRVYCKQNGVG